MSSNCCSLHCGQFNGVNASAYADAKAGLQKLFGLVEYNEATRALSLCGARGVDDMPDNLSQVFDMLALMLDTDGQGRIMVNCSGIFEVCFFRSGMWKLEIIGMPPDPFEGVHQAQ